MRLNLPNVLGEYLFDFELKNISFFKVGGKCDVFFTPKNEADLVFFLKNKPYDLNITILGNISNTLILDGGIRGAVINLKHMNNIEFYENMAKIEAGTNLQDFIKKSAEKGISSCEKLYCIPGSFGGAISMNAGIPGFEISDVLTSVDCLNLNGKKITISKDELKMEYRNSNIPSGFIITSCILKTSKCSKSLIEIELKEIQNKRLISQPVGKPTCGSTFKNPPSMKAWELIKSAGCNKLSFGGATVSEIHCNFLINSCKAKASDFVELIKIIKNTVFEKTGILLEEELKTIGNEF